MTTPAPKSERLFVLDALKGFAITCVVMGHALLRIVPDPASNAAYLFLSAFEMPLFMFLSGYILPGRVRGSRVVWLRKRAVRLLVPFFAWQAIFFLSRRLTPDALGSPLQLAEGLARYLAATFAAPTAGLWYLPALMLCSIGLALYFPLRTRPLLLARRGLGDVRGAAAACATASGWQATTGCSRPRRTGCSSRRATRGASGSARSSRASRCGAGRGRCSIRSSAVPVMRVMPALGAAGNGAAKVVLGLAGTGFSAVLLEMVEPFAKRIRLDALGRLTLGIYCSQWLFLRADAWIAPRLGTGAAGVLALFAFAMVGSIADDVAHRQGAGRARRASGRVAEEAGRSPT